MLIAFAFCLIIRYIKFRGSEVLNVRETEVIITILKVIKSPGLLSLPYLIRVKTEEVGRKREFLARLCRLQNLSIPIQLCRDCLRGQEGVLQRGQRLELFVVHSVGRKEPKLLENEKKGIKMKNIYLFRG